MTIDPRPARPWPIPPMDHSAGWKDTAFTWAMGHLILQRMADGETVKAITAGARMPAYCTVYRWMRVVPEFGEAVREVRDGQARMRLARQAARAAKKRARGGRASAYEPLTADLVLAAVAAGAALSHVLGRDGAPSAKAWYGWLRRRPELAEAYADACALREADLAADRERAIDSVWITGIRAANQAIRELEGRMGRLRPKLHRWWPGRGAAQDEAPADGAPADGPAPEPEPAAAAARTAPEPEAEDCGRWRARRLARRRARTGRGRRQARRGPGSMWARFMRLYETGGGAEA